MGFKTIYLTRHSIGYHNVDDDWTIKDAELTPLGRKQSAALNESTKDNIQLTAQLLVCSPLKRTLQTMLGSYPGLINHLGGKSNVQILPMLQEVNDYPCDIGSEKEELESIPEFYDLNFDLLEPGWNNKKGIYLPASGPERAREVRKWLRSRKEEEIVVVAHGDILRLLADGIQSFRPWLNAEVQVYTFESKDDDGAVLMKKE